MNLLAKTDHWFSAKNNDSPPSLGSNPKTQSVGRVRLATPLYYFHYRYIYNSRGKTRRWPSSLLVSGIRVSCGENSRWNLGHTRAVFRETRKDVKNETNGNALARHWAFIFSRSRRNLATTRRLPFFSESRLCGSRLPFPNLVVATLAKHSTTTHNFNCADPAERIRIFAFAQDACEICNFTKAR